MKAYEIKNNLLRQAFKYHLEKKPNDFLMLNRIKSGRHLQEFGNSLPDVSAVCWFMDHNVVSETVEKAIVKNIKSVWVNDDDDVHVENVDLRSLNKAGKNRNS